MKFKAKLTNVSLFIKTSQILENNTKEIILKLNKKKILLIQPSQNLGKKKNNNRNNNMEWNKNIINI
jgi:hypothetical protein